MNETRFVATNEGAQQELVKFLSLAYDSNQPCFMFSRFIDNEWHRLEKSSDEYSEFCSKRFGRFIEHRQSAGSGRIEWVDAYEQRFGNLSPLWFANDKGQVDFARYTSYEQTHKVIACWDCHPHPMPDAFIPQNNDPAKGTPASQPPPASDKRSLN